MSEEIGAGAAGMAVIAVMLLFYLAVFAFTVVVYVRIARKAGYAGWYVALAFVPAANVVVLIMFAFTEWPIERELRAARAAAQGGYRPLPPSGYGYGAVPASPFPGGAPAVAAGPAPLPSQPVFGRPSPEAPQGFSPLA